MKLKNLSLIALFVASTSPVLAATTTTTTTRTTSTQSQTMPLHQSSKSAKKAEADRGGSLTAPQVIEQGDNLVGVRASQGTAFDNNPVVGLSYEHIVRPNFGVGLQGAYASYSNRYNVAGVSGQFDYTALTLVATGNFHADVLKVRNLDTFVSAGIGHSWLNSRWKSNLDFPSPGGSDTNATFLTAALNARYFVDSNWGFTASLGTGLGTLGLGMDYLF